MRCSSLFDIAVDILIAYLHDCSLCVFRKPKNQRVKRALEKRESKIYENDKTAIFVRGGHTSETVTQFMAELVSNINYNNVFGYMLHSIVFNAFLYRTDSYF